MAADPGVFIEAAYGLTFAILLALAALSIRRHRKLRREESAGGE